MSSRLRLGVFLAIFSLALFATSCEYTDYYVATTGNDATGDGSRIRPWRTIQHALDHIDYSRRPPPKLRVLPGEYAGPVSITHSIFIYGDGSDPSRVSLVSDRDDFHYVVTIRGDIGVRLENIRINGRMQNGGLNFDSIAPVEDRAGNLFLHRVEIYRPQGFGIWITGLRDFIISETAVDSGALYYSDVGLRIERSRGLVNNFTGGNYIDHIISIEEGSTVRIDTARLTGSPVWYADGIRTFKSNATILNAQITRPADGAETMPPDQREHGTPYAGIEVHSDLYNRNLFVRVEHCTTSGFDVGLGIMMDGSGLKVSDSELSGLSAAISTYWYEGRPVNPVVDLGGGGLSSRGGNRFSSPGRYILYHRAPYDISARGNRWGVLGTDIEDSIYDRMDDTSLGRVLR